MNLPTNVVSIHPYFKVQPGKMDEFKALMREFVRKTTTEERALYYEFTINGDEVFCREGYIGAEGVLAHLANVSDQVEAALGISRLARLELHGPAEELARLKDSLAGLKPVWFELEHGMRR